MSESVVARKGSRSASEAPSAAVQAAQRIVYDLGDLLPEQYQGGDADALTVARALLDASPSPWREMEEDEMARAENARGSVGETPADALRIAAAMLNSRNGTRDSEALRVWRENARIVARALINGTASAFADGQRAMARHVYGICEETTEKIDPGSGEFNRGRYSEAKGIAKAVCSIAPYKAEGLNAGPPSEASTIQEEINELAQADDGFRGEPWD